MGHGQGMVFGTVIRVLAPTSMGLDGDLVA